MGGGGWSGGWGWGGRGGKNREAGAGSDGKASTTAGMRDSVITGALLGRRRLLGVKHGRVVRAVGVDVVLLVHARWRGRQRAIDPLLLPWLRGWPPVLRLLPPLHRGAVVGGCCILLHVCNAPRLSLPRAGLSGEGGAADASGGAVVCPAALAAAAALGGCAPRRIVAAAVVACGLHVAAASVAGRLVGAAAVVAAAVVAAAAAAAAVGAALLSAAAAVAIASTAAVVVVVVVVTEGTRGYTGQF